jgi:hypothetical protein
MKPPTTNTPGSSQIMTESTQYTATVISMGANGSTGLFDQYLEKSIPPLDTLEECISLCHFLIPVYREHLKKGAIPTLLKIETQAGLVVLADIHIEQEPLAFTLIWRDTLKPSDQVSLNKGLEYNLKQSTKMVWDQMGAAENECAGIQVGFLRQILASATYVEPYRETIKLVYKVEAKLGKSTSKVRDLEESLGL